MSHAPAMATLSHTTLALTFWIKAVKTNKAGKMPISMRLTLHGKRAEISTGIRCLPEEWNKDKKRLVSVKWDEEQRAYLPAKLTNATRQLNTLLDDLEAKARLLMSDMRQHVVPGRPVTARALRAKLLCPHPEPELEPCVLVLLREASNVYANLATRAGAETAIRAFGRFLAPATTLLVSDLTPTLCAKFRAWITEHTSATAANNYSRVLQALTAHALPDLRSNPFAQKGVRRPSAVKPRYVLSQQELAKLAEAVLPKTAALARDIYLAQYYLHGSRIGAVLTLPWAQVDWERGRVQFKAEKGGDWHSVVLRPQLAAILRRYHTPGATGPVFPLLPDGYAKLSTAEQYKRRKSATAKVWHGLQIAAQQIGLAGRLHSHTARHTLATHTVQATGDFRAAQALLGHGSLAMTEKYVRSMLPDEKDAAADAVYGTGESKEGGKVIPLYGSAA
jgi:integrase